MSICITTGYKDIGRANWEAFGRPREVYMRGFRRLVQQCPYPLVAYLEKDVRETMDIRSPFLRVLPMEEFDLVAYSHMEKDWEVMNSPEYAILMKGCRHRSEHPERSKKGYNMVTSSKSNMVAHTKAQFPGYKWYAWQDFGHANNMGGIPRKIDETKLPMDKITIKGMDYDPTKGPAIDPVGFARIGGAAYVCSAQIIVPNHMVELFDDLMRKQIDYNHSIGLTDDDQSVLTVVANQNRHLFNWIGLGTKWFALWDYFAGDFEGKIPS